MFNEATMEKLDFLIGRWTGSAPDGSTFYEEYMAADATTLRSLRYNDATFASMTDSSTVSLKDGQIISTWGEFVWKATNISDGYAAFEPINAPSSFSWKRVDDDTVEVTQKWTDENGVAQSYALHLLRVK